MRGFFTDDFKPKFTDNLILNVISSSGINWSGWIDSDLEYIDSKEAYTANPHQTFAEYFINKSEELFEERGDFLRNPSSRLYFDELREKIKNFNYWRAFTETLSFVIDVFAAGDIQNHVKTRVVGIRKSKDGGKEGGKKSGIIRRQKTIPIKEIWQAEADKILKKPKNSKLSKSRIAELITEKIGGNPDTIRKYIKKPTP